MRRLLLSLALCALASAPCGALAQGSGSGVAVMPLKARGLSPAEYRRLTAKIAGSFRETRPDVVMPEDLAARLARDERQKTALDEARRLSNEGLEKSHALDHAAAIDRYDRAIQLYREHYGEYADPDALAEAYIRRAAERLTVNDANGARADFFNAVSCAPDAPPSPDDYPPPVVDGWEQARAERVRRPLAGEDPQTLAALGSALGLGAVATTRAEKGDRPEDGIAVEIAVWPVAAHASAPRVAHAMLGADSWDAVAGAVREAAGAPRVASAGTVTRPIDVHEDPIVRPDPIRPPPRRPRSGAAGERPLWKNPWLWAGAGVLAAGVAGGAYAANRKPESKGYRVIVTPGS